MLKKGLSKQEVLLRLGGQSGELNPLLDISAALLSVPKNIVPTPLMRRKYAAAKAKTVWLAWLHISRFAAVSASAMLLVSAFAVTGYEASKSTPGNVLFTLKQGEENLRVVLASSQNQKASLQVAIAEQRLNDARQVFSNPASNQQEKTAALAALSYQTTTAIAQVNTVAEANPKSDVNHPLLSSLDNITKEQQTLLSQIKPDPQIKIAANTALAALNTNAEKISQIKQTIAVSDSGQNGLTSLAADPNSVTVFGGITAVSNAKITVEQTTFNIGSQTVISDDSGKNLSINDLSQGEKVNVVGIKSDQNLVARQILLTNIQPAPGQPEVKSAATGSAVTIKKTVGENSSTSSASNTATPQTDPNTAAGLFIFEDPNPQLGK